MSEQYLLPEGWRWARLGEILKEPLKNGLNYRKEDFGAGIKFVNVSDVFCPVNVNTTKLDRINVSPKNVEKYQLQTGDILIVRSSLKREGVAYPALFVEDEEPVVFCGFLIRIRPDKEKIEPFYLLSYLRSSIAREKLIGGSDTVTITNVDQETLLSLNIPLAPLPEQKRIATKLQEIMQEVKRARTACEKHLEAVKALPGAYLREVFESEEAKKWERNRLEKVCELIMGQSPPGSTYIDKPEGLPFFQGKADFGDYFPMVRVWCTQPTKIAEKGDILISVRAPVGPVNMNNLKCCVGRGLAAIRCKDYVTNWFIFWYLRFIEAQIASLGSGSTFGAITRNDLINLQIPLPPIEEQKRIAAELKEKMSEVEKLRASIEKRLEAINALPQAILRKAFRGKL